MRIENKVNTIIYADEGKLLKRIADGQIVGESVHLGYNYYEVGFMLNEPKLSLPEDFEEINKPIYEKLDVPENYEEVDRPEYYQTFEYTVDQPRRLKRMLEIIAETKKEINTYGLSNEEALKVKEMFPLYEDIVNTDVLKGFKFLFNGNLYEVLKDTKILPFYEPSENTKELYKQL